jgi:hypothetical protein
MEKPDIENIRGLNLAVVKLTTVQVTRQPLQHKICTSKIDMIYPTKPVLAEDLCVVQKQTFFYLFFIYFLITCYMCEMYT